MVTAEEGALQLELHDGQARRWIHVLDDPDLTRHIRSLRYWNWATDPGLIRPGVLHHAVFIVDGAAGVATALVDGVLCDGGTARIQGWARLNPYVQELNDDLTCQVGEDLSGEIAHLRLYERYLRTFEALSNYRAGPTGRRDASGGSEAGQV